MDKAQVLEEIDIIVRAKIEQAKKDINNIKNEVKNMAKSLTKEFNQVEKSGQLNGLSKDLNKAKKDIENFSDEVRKVKINMGDISFSYDLKDVEDFKKQYNKAIEDMESQKSKINLSNDNDTPTNNSQSQMSIKPKVDLTSTKSQVDELKQNIESVSNTKIDNPINKIIQEIINKTKELQTQFSKIELSGFDPYKVMNLKDAISMLKEEIVGTIPYLGNIRDSFRTVFADAKDPITKVTNMFLTLKQNGISAISDMVSNIKGKFSDISNDITSKVKPITDIFKDTGTVAKRIFEEVKEKIGSVAEKVNKPISKIKSLINHFKDVKKYIDNVKKSGSGIGDSLSKGISKGISSIKKFTMSLLGVRGAFTLVRKATSAYLSFDTQLSESMQNSWNVLGSLLAPALEFVTSLFSKLVSVVATFVKVLTGVDLVARANSKALDKQAKSTNKAVSASKQLSGIDDINNLTTNDSSGGNADTAGTITVEDVDITPLNKFFEKAKEIFSKIFQPFQEAWDSQGVNVINSIKDAFSGTASLAESIGTSFLEIWTNGTITETISLLLGIFSNMFEIIGQIRDGLSEAWNKGNTGTQIFQSISNIFNDILKFVKDIGDFILTWVISDGFQNALDTVLGIVKDIFGWFEEISGWLLEMYEKYIQPVLIDKVLPAIDDIVQAIKDIWEVAKPVIDNIVDVTKKMLEPAIKGLGDLIGGLSDIIGGIAKFVSGVFSGDWKKAWDGIKQIFKGVMDAFGSIVKTPINMVISAFEFLVNKLIGAFNSFKRMLNNIHFDIPDWVPGIGGKGFGFNLKMTDEIKIPRLETGNVATEPTLAMFGEYANAKSDPEITSPISMMKGAFRDVLSEIDFGGTRVNTLKIDVAGKNFFDEVIEYIDEKYRRKGVSVIKEV